MKKERLSPPAVGGASLLVIFTVLMLTVLALLSLSQARADRRLAEASAQAVEDYYAADLQAEEVFARLRNAEQVSGVMVTGNRYAYSCPISADQTLFVELEKTAEGWIICRWQAVAHPEQPKETLPLWGAAD